MELSIEIKPREIPQDIIREHEVKQRRFHNITLYNMGVILQENGFEYDNALSRYDKQCDGCIFVVRFNLSFYELEIRGYHKLANKTFP